MTEREENSPLTSVISVQRNKHSAWAQCKLGVCYQFGRGVAKDEAEAVKWYRKAAEQGNADAQFNLGLCYANGHGVGKDEVEAVKWFRKAAETENVNALNALAWILATSENSAIRDGANAVVFAEKAVFVADKFPKDYEKHMYLDTLAAAYAEAGQFEKAVSTEQEAIGLVQTEAYKNDYKARLKLFEAKLPYRAKD
jgi:tetratricopeptide (TPR) repeat protein